MVRNQFSPPCGFDIATTTVQTEHGLEAIKFWGYRLVVHPSGTLFVHETYYDDREGVLGFASAPARPCGDSKEEVNEELLLMIEGLNEPILRYTDFGAIDQPFNRYGFEVPPEEPGGDGAV